MRHLISLLKKESSLRAWQISRLEKISNEVYCIGKSTEAVRCNQTVEYSLTLHTGSKKDVLGESSTVFSPVPGIFTEILSETQQRASLVENPAYEFSDPWRLPDRTNPIEDLSLKDSLAEYIETSALDILNMNSEELHGCRLASFEIFAEKYRKTVVNSKGLELTMPSTRLAWDFVLISPDNQFEINSLLHRRFAKDLPFRKILQEESKALLDLQKAALPPTGTFPVILCSEALDTIFDFFTSQANGQSLYYDTNVISVGQSIYSEPQNAQSTLTIDSDPFLEGGLNSHFFDYLGYPMSQVRLYDEGTLKNFAIDGKLSCLLKKDMTSAMANLIVPAGTESVDSWRQNGVIELHKFSTFHPNTVSGAFSGEIRLGYLYKDGRKIPLRGGSVAGSSLKAFQNVKFSREKEKRSAYFGPSALFFQELTIAGE